MTTADPHSAAEIAAALRAVHEESVTYWQSFATPEFLAAIGTAWSPADNVRHLTKSVQAVSGGLRVPRWVLWLAFRSGRGTSRSYGEVRETYRARLARGASAGKFAPAPRPPAVDPEAERTRVMTRHANSIDELVSLVARWPENALDRRRLPHPLLGPLTVREMLLFTVYHNRHHVDVVRGRLAAAGLAAGST
jgi:hypothetical protein